MNEKRALFLVVGFVIQIVKDRPLESRRRISSDMPSEDTEAIIRRYCRPGQELSRLLLMKQSVQRETKYALPLPMKRNERQEDAFRATVIKEVNESVRNYEEHLHNLSERTGIVWKRRSGSRYTYFSSLDGTAVSPTEYKRKYYLAMNLPG